MPFIPGGGGGGTSGSGVPGSPTNSVQFNDAGGFGGDAGFTYSAATNTAILVGALNTDTINENTASNGVNVDGVLLKDNFVEFDAVRGIRESGATLLPFDTIADGQYLKRVGASIVGSTISAGGGSFTGASGINTQVQYNDNGNLAGAPSFIFNKTTNALTQSGSFVTSVIEPLFSSTGVIIDGVYITNGVVESDAIRGLRETSGPTVLTIGSVSDGQYLKRNGTSLIGDTPAGGGGSTAGLLSGSASPNQSVLFVNGSLVTGKSTLTFAETTNTLSVNGEIYIEGEVGHSTSTPYFRVRDSSSNDLVRVLGDGSLENNRGTIVPIYRNNSVGSNIDMGVTSAADRTYLFLNPAIAEVDLYLKASPENGRSYVVSHIGSGNVINVRPQNTGVIIVTIAPQFSALVVYDSTKWINLA